MVAFYSEIEKAVSKRKMMADWKIKRLQLDVRRVQLLTSEKVNFSRECMELKHKDEKIPDYENNQKKFSNDTVSQNELSTNESNTVTPISDKSVSLNSPSDLNNIEQSTNITSLADINSNPLENNTNFLSTNTTKLQKTNLLPVNDDHKLSDINSNISSTTGKSNVRTELSPSDILNSNILLIEEKSNNNVQKSFQNQRLEALKNKNKVLSHEYGMSIESSSSILSKSKNNDVLSVINNNVSEAQRNKTRVLGSNFDSENNTVSHSPDSPQYDTDACREALRNKTKVLGHEFGIDVNFDSENITVSHSPDSPQYDTDACREASRNKKKVLGHEFGINVNFENKPTLKQRDNLKLDLKNCNKPLRVSWDSKTSQNSNLNNLPMSTTPGSIVNTPSDFNVRGNILLFKFS